jgi:phospholipid-binding lipoprotein MlaA
MPRTAHRPTGRVATRLAALLIGTASAWTAAAAEPAKDPFERVNRATYAFNDALDRMLARPAAKAYRAVVPQKAREVVSNFLANLAYPTVIVNDALQAKFRDAGSDTLRLLTNTVVGVGGLFDPATHFGLAAHDEDFGQTLGVWGVKSGPYLVLPFLGPSDLRDGPARLVDHFTAGDYYLRYAKNRTVKSSSTEYALFGLRFLGIRSELLSTDEALRQAYDPYAVMRNAYLAHREYLVHDGNLPEESYDDPTGDSGSRPEASAGGLSSAAVVALVDAPAATPETAADSGGGGTGDGPGDGRPVTPDEPAAAAPEDPART